MPLPLRLDCPVCQDEHTHLDGVDTYTEGKDRRISVRLIFYCERGHDFQVEFAQRQGFTLIATEEI